MQESGAKSLASSPAPPGFSELLASAQQPLYAFVAGLVADAELARDIVQDVFCDAWRATQRGAAPFAATLDGDEVRRWLFHAAYCDAASALRRRGLIGWESLNAQRATEPAPLRDAGRFEDTIAERQALEAALATLRPEDAACLLLNALQGVTSSEIGQIIGVSAEASKKRLARAKHRLREAYLRLNAPQEERQP